MSGYHINEIPLGVVGEFSKVIEEFLEFEDSLEQSAVVMALIELSDLLGAIQEFFSKNQKESIFNELLEKIKNNSCYRLVDFSDLRENFSILNQAVKINDFSKFEIFLEELDCFAKQYNLTINDLYIMSQITRRVFVNGYRQSKGV